MRSISRQITGKANKSSNDCGKNVTPVRRGVLNPINQQRFFRFESFEYVPTECDDFIVPPKSNIKDKELK